MPTPFRASIAVFVLVAVLGGLAGVRPCLDDDECAMSCGANASQVCSETGKHHDPVAPIHFCDCMCHVPAVAMSGSAVSRPGAPEALDPVPSGSPLSLGFLDSPFRPPRT